MTRGFVTVATGRDEYYKQALNMLHSFRLHNPNVPFAILCDQENEYTREFDDVVVLEGATRSYRDKFRLLTDCPYDENIFIETDCLIYRNLGFFWNLLAKEWDFTSFGWNDGATETWVESKDCMAGIEATVNRKIEKYPILNPGYLFIRTSDKTRKMFEDIQVIEKYLIENWKDDNKLFVRGNLRDDPLFFMAMELNDMKCPVKPSVGKCLAVPSGYQYLSIDIAKGLLDAKDKKGKEINNCSLLHFSAKKVREEGLYPWQVSVLNAKLKGRPEWFVSLLKSRFVGSLFSIYRYITTRIGKYLLKK